MAKMIVNPVKTAITTRRWDYLTACTRHPRTAGQETRSACNENYAAIHLMKQRLNAGCQKRFKASAMALKKRHRKKRLPCRTTREPSNQSHSYQNIWSHRETKRHSPLRPNPDELIRCLNQTEPVTWHHLFSQRSHRTG